MILKVIAGTSPKRKKTIFNKLVFFDLSRNAKRKQMKKNWAQISALTTRQIPKNKRGLFPHQKPVIPLNRKKATPRGGKSCFFAERLGSSGIGAGR